MSAVNVSLKGKMWLTLLAGALSASGSLVYLQRLDDSMYLRDRDVMLWAVSPYLLCAWLWAAAKSQRKQKAGLFSALLLLSATLVIYLPLVISGQVGGDMVGIGFVLISMLLCAGVLAASLLFWWLS